VAAAVYRMPLPLQDRQRIMITAKDIAINEGCYKPLLAGVDTLEVGFCVDEYLIDDYCWDTLEWAKLEAQSTHFDNYKGQVTLAGKRFMVKRSGAQRYNYILENDDVTVKIFKEARGGRNYPELVVTFRSHFLWRSGWQDALGSIVDWVNTWVRGSVIKPSRVDLTVDFIGPLPQLSPDLREVVTRAKGKTAHLETVDNASRYSQGRLQSGYSFGKGDLSCRIYNKKLEIAKSNKGWFKELWRDNGWQEGQPVTRVEFQCRRAFLRSLQIETIDYLVQLPDVWHYTVNNWIAIKEPSPDTHRSRWPDSEFWQAVKSATPLFGDITGVSRLKQLRPKAEALQRQLRGCMTSLGALAIESLPGCPVSYGRKYVKSLMNKWLESSEFEDDVRIKAAKFASM
jgi:hypothetical protein